MLKINAFLVRGKIIWESSLTSSSRVSLIQIHKVGIPTAVTSERLDMGKFLRAHVTHTPELGFPQLAIVVVRD